MREFWRSDGHRWIVGLIVVLTMLTLGACSVVDSQDRTDTKPKTGFPRIDLPGSTERGLRGDPGFSVGSLSGDAAVWYGRLIETIATPSSDLDPKKVARSDDLYHYGRPLQVYVESTLAAFRLTGDLTLLDHVDEIAEVMRAQLRDSWRGTLDGTDGTRDGYLNWVWRYSSGDDFVGKDTHVVDDVKAHALIALMAAALHTNRDLESPAGRDYAAHADFWRDYLVNHFEAKWRKRMDKPHGFPIMTMSTMHSFVSWVRWHYYMAMLTGDDRYLDEAKGMADVWWAEMRAVTTSGGTAYVWPRGVLGLGAQSDYLMPTVYASMVIADAVELHLEGFHRWASADEMERFARTFTRFMLDTSDPAKNGIAADIGGGTARAGLWSDAKNWPRMTMHGFWLSGFPLLAAWDDTGRIAAFTNEAHAARGPNVGMMLQTGALLGDVLESAAAAPPDAPDSPR